MHVGIMASQGIENVQVYRVPEIGVMATGDELMPVGHALMQGKIYDSNGPRSFCPGHGIGNEGNQVGQRR